MSQTPEGLPSEAHGSPEPSEFPLAATGEASEPEPIADVVPITSGTLAGDTVESEQETVSRPQSIFRTSGAQAPTPAAGTPELRGTPDDDWVSHEPVEPTPQQAQPPTPAVSEQAAAAKHLEGDALWHVETYPDPPTPTQTPFFMDPQAEATGETDLWSTVNETEALLSSINPATTLDVGTGLGVDANAGATSMFDDVNAVADPPPAPNTEAFVPVEEEMLPTPRFDTDEDLPIPDFSGVFDVSPEDSQKWNMDAALAGKSAEGQVTQTNAMMRRDELDRLRPPSEVPVEEDSSERNLAARKYFLMLALALVLAVVLLVFPGVLGL